MGKKDKKVKKEKKGGKRMTKKQLVEKLTDLIQLNAPESVSLKRIYAELKLNTHPLKMLCLDILQDMLTDDFICEPEKGRYKLKNPDQIVTGTFQRKSNGKNSLLPEDGSTPEIFSDFTRLLGGMALDGLDRWAFYGACCEPKVRLAISTGEKRVFANILLTVGVA